MFTNICFKLFPNPHPLEILVVSHILCFSVTVSHLGTLYVEPAIIYSVHYCTMLSLSTEHYVYICILLHTIILAGSSQCSSHMVPLYFLGCHSRPIPEHLNNDCFAIGYILRHLACLMPFQYGSRSVSATVTHFINALSVHVDISVE